MSTLTDDEHVVLVEPDGTILGSAPKLASHHANTPLHLAFSCYIFNDDGKFLVTQRAHHKKVWPGVWTNSCCGHVALGETTEQALQRRVQYELGMDVKDVQVILPKYTYKTPPFNGVVDHEICPVFLARAASAVTPLADEVADYRWIDWDDYVAQLEQDAKEETNVWSWWCKDQLKQITRTKRAENILSTYLTPPKQNDFT